MSAGADPAGDLRDRPVTLPVVSSEPVFRGHVWDVRNERFVLDGQQITRHFVDHTGAVAVLVVDDAERVLLISQYRHPVRLRDWELPAGLLDVPGEDPLAAAERELEEEADLAATEWWVLQDLLTSPGGSDESIRVYLARGARPVETSYVREHEEADIEVRWVALDEAVEAVRRGDIANATTVSALLAAAVSRAGGWRDLRPSDAPWPTRSAGPRATGHPAHVPDDERARDH